MNDFLLQLGQNPAAKNLVKSLGLPIPMPQSLSRAKGPRVAQELAGLKTVVGGTPDPRVHQHLAQSLIESGCNCFLSSAELEAFFSEPAEAFGRPTRIVEVSQSSSESTSEAGSEPRAQALVFDASSIERSFQLRQLYDFFHPQVRSLAKCGRVVVLGRAPQAAMHPEAAAVQSALEGFVRSLAKELGKKGSTANLLVVEEGAEDRLSGPLEFLLSKRSAFVSGQVLRVTALCEALGDGCQVASRVAVLEGKRAVVTGAARGIGAATAQRLASEGAKVFGVDRPGDEEALSRCMKKIGGIPLVFDVADSETPDRLAQQLKEQGGIDILVHNAGVTRDKTLGRMSPEAWDQTIDINLAAILRIDQALLEHDVLRPCGREICLSSVSGIAGNLGQCNYAASKRGLIAYIEHQARRSAARGLTVNAVAPGFIETRMTARMPVMIREAARRLSALGQGGQPEDVAEVITFLATPGAHGISGQVLRACGGAFVGA